MEGTESRGEARVGLPYVVAAKRGRKRWGRLQIFVIQADLFHVIFLHETVDQIQNFGRDKQYILSAVDLNFPALIGYGRKRRKLKIL